MLEHSPSLKVVLVFARIVSGILSVLICFGGLGVWVIATMNTVGDHSAASLFAIKMLFVGLSLGFIAFGLFKAEREIKSFLAPSIMLIGFALDIHLLFSYEIGLKHHGLYLMIQIASVILGLYLISFSFKFLKSHVKGVQRD